MNPPHGVETDAPSIRSGPHRHWDRVLQDKYHPIHLNNDFKIRKAAAWAAAKNLNRLWRSKILDDKIKFNLFQTLVVSILLYNAVTWTVNITLSKLLDSCYNKLLRYCLNIIWTPDTPNISNHAIYQKFSIKSISTVLLYRRLTFAGHCYRSFQSAPQPVMDVLFLKFNNTQNRGNRSNYRKLLCQDTGYDEIQLQNEMLNRTSYRRLVKNITR